MNIVEIAKAWIAAANPSPEQKQLAEYRAGVCNECPHKAHNKLMDIYICDMCGCPLSKKIFSGDKNSCPDKRWIK
jgi:DNA-directed RNA polymerase subunit RPC12/RpoP